MTNSPNKDSVWDEEHQRWKMGNMYYMPDKTTYSPWCFYDFVNDRVIASGEPNRVIKLNNI